jgi:catechol 2,3-dioxygenase-like lactoylglutathione lyase family enzyme
MKRRSGEPWMPARAYGRSLTALTVNLLVHDIGEALVFQREVLGVAVVYSDPDFAVLRGYDAEWMLHADHTYEHHPLSAVIAGGGQRGAGIELRLHGCDPDAAETAARQRGFTVLASASDKGHGLREAHLVDADGYVWVPDVPTIDAITREPPAEEQTHPRMEGTASVPNPIHDLFAWGRQLLAAQPLSNLFGAQFSALSTGHAELTMPLAPTLLQQHGFVHGGLISYAAAGFRYGRF